MEITYLERPSLYWAVAQFSYLLEPDVQMGYSNLIKDEKVAG